MKRKVLFVLFTFIFCSTGLFAQQNYGNGTQERENFYKETPRPELDNDESAESRAPVVKEKKPLVSENFLGAGISVLGPEFSYTHRTGHFQADASLMGTYTGLLTIGFLNYFAVTPKIDAGFYFTPFNGMFSGFVGGFMAFPVVINPFNPEQKSFFLWTVLGGIEGSLIHRLSSKQELAYTFYIPFIPLSETGKPSDYFLFAVGFTTVYLRFKL